MTTIAITRPLPPAPRPVERRVRLRAGWYDRDPAWRGRVYVPAQTAAVLGWRYAAWDGGSPTAAVLYVQVSA